MNSHSDSESPTESGRDGGSNALKPLKTAAAEPVCEQNVRFLGSMDARRAADAGRRAVCGQRLPGSAPDLHDDVVLLHQSLPCKKPQLHLAVLWSWYSERPELRTASLSQAFRHTVRSSSLSEYQDQRTARCS